ncbi:hypothetical protein [Dyadobacter sp. LHD-138]|uniref:hypothetical protein n=1 Tax=Dyadobacter sp. LHD-138 TaxID=3071413 RepID=UPI0027E0BBB7|nr:hypothetical protein [Dyadobacter sp. LHD-138]MDQ6482629.1 hypothetical protein [Dyadobacter sp. LHD-138]
MSEKFQNNGTYAFSENKVTIHIELEGLESVPVNPAGVVFGKAQNAWNGVVQRINGITSSANAYLNSTAKTVSDGLSPVDGIAFTSSSGQGQESRRSSYPTRGTVNIDDILGAAGITTADPSKARIGGDTALGKIISVMEMMKEALGFGQSAGDAVEALKPDAKKDSGESAQKTDDKSNAKFSSETWNQARDESNYKTKGWTSAGSSVNKDSSKGVVDYYNGTQLIKTDTLKPKNNDN